jgi:hypothetical protein
MTVQQKRHIVNNRFTDRQDKARTSWLGRFASDQREDGSESPVVGLMIDDETEARTSCTVLLIDNDGSQSAGCSLIDNETEVKAALARFADRLGGGSQSAMARFADQEEVSFLYCDRPRIVHYRCSNILRIANCHTSERHRRRRRRTITGWGQG